ncbi:MAG: 1-acyl-sn-glycerol-3-phosphate acyltransferase [Bradymonadia bacterium]|jgi:1-acyl-sn-glycerol-3-phosphate acyltransferase
MSDTPSTQPLIKSKTHLPWICGFLGKVFLKLFGWRVEGDMPVDVPKAVFIAAPHTSNWDGVIMVAIAWRLRVRFSFLAKKELLGPGAGWLMRWFGAVPVDRSKNSNTVQSAVDLFTDREGMFLAVPPSGTRSKRDHWKSGFYHIARGAQVPLICGFIDFKRKVGGIGPVLTLTGDIPADMDLVRAFYEPIVGKYHDKTSTIRMREETTTSQEAA